MVVMETELTLNARVNATRIEKLLMTHVQSGTVKVLIEVVIQALRD